MMMTKWRYVCTVLRDTTMTRASNVRRTLCVAAAATMALLVGASAEAAITAVNSGSFGGSDPTAGTSVTVTQSVTAGASADMLVLMTSSEIGTGTITATYGGVPMTHAVGNQAHSDIFYLDLSVGGFTNTNIAVTLTSSTINGFAAGWVSIDGNLGAGEKIKLHSTGTTVTTTNTVDLTTSVETFNVVNFNGNNTSGTVTVNSPNPTVIYTDINIGSARAAAAYAAGVPAGTNTYQWTLTVGTLPTDYRRIDAAAFAVVPPVGTLISFQVE